MLFSLVVPGAGQYTLEQRRTWLYAAIEVVGTALYFERRGAGSDARRGYRDLAWTRARLQSGARLDGDFGYYETLSHWERSGAYDLDALRAGVQPEPDPATFNGSVWRLAAQIYLGGDASVPETDPAYGRALDYYGERAYGEEFLWDWTAAGTGQQEFSALIARSDERFQQATHVLGAVLLNHLVSSVDAFLSARGMMSRAVDLGVSPGVAPHGATWTAWARLRGPL
jgi:hypothetical protein